MPSTDVTISGSSDTSSQSQQVPSAMDRYIALQAQRRAIEAEHAAAQKAILQSHVNNVGLFSASAASASESYVALPKDSGKDAGSSTCCCVVM